MSTREESSPAIVKPRKRGWPCVMPLFGARGARNIMFTPVVYNPGSSHCSCSRQRDLYFNAGGPNGGDKDEEVEVVVPEIQSVTGTNPQTDTPTESPSDFEFNLGRNIYDSFSQLSLDDMSSSNVVNCEVNLDQRESSEEPTPQESVDPEFRIGGRLHRNQGIRGRTQFLTERLISALDYSRVSHRQAVHILSAVFEALGIDAEKMVMNKSSFDEIRRGEPECPKKLIINNESDLTALSGKDMDSFINSPSLRFFERFQIKTDFLQLRVESWDTNPDFLDGLEVVLKLRVVNDTAERAVKLTEEYINRTKDEELKQALLLTIPQYKRAHPDANKSRVVKKNKQDE
ncbi:hypothetical protein QAD02_022514 [Eretmocerus hayati]|uniref:Uncharacterized protein n=1 Tax=Eretmocerus hayati TaxID=131215 RepID=A0ACC2PTF9_9HYME|nr:hypothetical protein QAD02_022514 [Eretmocerus hayati]